MRDPKRIPKILKEIEKIWKRHPDLRLTQLLVNSSDNGAFYQREDEELIADLKKYNKQIS